MSKYNFINPYSFFPLLKEPARGKAKDRTFTGVIEYSLLTKTPLFIPNTSNENAFCIETSGHKSYDFFSYKDLSKETESVEDQPAMPVIPGSEMRGMLRANFEILTNSCMSSVDDDVVLSKRTNHVYRPGLIKRRKKEKASNEFCYDLYEAKVYRMEQTNAFKEGQKVFFCRNKKAYASNVSAKQETVHNCDGYFKKGEQGPSKKKHHIFVLCGDNPLKEGISLDTLDLVLKEYQNRQEGGISQEDRVYKEYIDALEQFRKGKPAEEEQEEPYFPVYYSLVQDNSAGKSYLMLSPASITREIYHRKISELLGNYRPCSEDKELCPACSLFGTVTETFAKTSRIRFSDLTCKEDAPETCYIGTVTLQPLSSPKISNTEFYLKRPEGARFWTYDYYVDKEGKLHLNKEGINGRKFYWHQMDEELKHLEAKESTKLNVTIRPVKKDICFSGKLYFQDLTQEELKQLCFLLNGGEMGALSKKKHGYKLGGAKPLGLGSVAMNVDKVLLRSVEMDADLKQIVIKEKQYEYSIEDLNIDLAIKENFFEMTNFDAVKDKKDKNVDYPRLEENGDIYRWFGKNHGSIGTRGSFANKMPNSREKMAFREYMKPMEKGLATIEGTSGKQNKKTKEKS